MRTTERGHSRLAVEAGCSPSDALSNLNLVLPSFPVLTSASPNDKASVISTLDELRHAIERYSSKKGKRRPVQDGHVDKRASDWLDIEGETIVLRKNT